MASGRLEKLLNFYKDNPEDPFILFAIAKEYDALEDLDKALTAFLQLMEKAPDYVGTYYHLGKLYEKQEAYAKAFHTYREGMEVAQKAGDQHAYNELAGAKLALGDDEDFE